MPRVTQLPKAVTLTDNGVFVVVDNGKAQQISWKALRESNLRGNIGYIGSTGFVGSASTRIGFTGSSGRGFTGSTGAGFTGSAGVGSLGYTGSVGYNGSVGYTGSVGFTGSLGYNGSVGFVGSQGLLGYVGSTGLAGPSSTPLTLIKTTATNYTPTTGDHGYYIRMNNASTATVTLVADSVEAIPVGTTYIVGQVNTGGVTFSTGSGAVIYSPASLAIVARWGKVTVIKTAVNTWEIDGAI
jgi:hypothetical protein